MERLDRIPIISSTDSEYPLDLFIYMGCFLQGPCFSSPVTVTFSYGQAGRLRPAHVVCLNLQTFLKHQKKSNPRACVRACVCTGLGQRWRAAIPRTHCVRFRLPGPGADSPIGGPGGVSQAAPGRAPRNAPALGIFRHPHRLRRQPPSLSEGSGSPCLRPGTWRELR